MIYVVSEENIVDCSQKYGNAGCGGGRIFLKFFVTADLIVKKAKSISFVYIDEKNASRVAPISPTLRFVQTGAVFLYFHVLISGEF